MKKKILIWRYSRKHLDISDTLIFLSKPIPTVFLIFGLKLVLIWPSIWMKPIFQKKLQFGDTWPRNRQKIAQIEVFDYFLDFALLNLLFLGSLSLRNHWIPASNKEWVCVRSQQDVAGSCFIICSLKSVSEGGWRYHIIRKFKEKVVEYKCKCKGESYYLKTDFGK